VLLGREVKLDLFVRPMATNQRSLSWLMMSVLVRAKSARRPIPLDSVLGPFVK
jgi:hypothetical protein